MGETITIRTGAATEVIKVIEQGPQGPQGPAGSGLTTLTTAGDMLYRDASGGQRLAIGTSGQVLKVANGIPAWGNESGAVTSVNGETGAVSLSAADVGAAAAAHTHDGTQVEIVADDATGPVLAAGFSEGSGVNGIYWPTDTTANALLVYKLNRTYGMFFEAGRWHIYELAPLSANIVVSSDLDDTDYPHQSNWPTGSVTKASLSNFGDNAAQQFRFVGDSMAVADVTNAVSTSDSRLTDSRTPTSHTHGNLTNDGKVGTTANLPLKTGTNGVIEAGSFGTAAGSFCEGNDARLSDDRDPNLHAASHAAGGGDPVILSQLDSQPSGGVNKFKLGLGGDSPTGRFVGVSTAVDPIIGILSYGSAEQYNPSAEVSSSAFGMTLGATDFSMFAQYLKDGGLEAQYDFPAASGTVALTDDIPTEVTDLAATGISADYVPVAQGDGTIVWEAQSGGGGGDTVSIETTAADILSVSSGAISADDAGADRIVYWNNTSNKLTYGTPSDVGAAASSHTHSDATQSVAGFLSTADKTKLDGIASGAEVNVNADWNASSGDAQILNKPTLGTAAAAATTDFAAASHTHPASAISDSTTAGRALLTGADAAAQRTTLGLGTLATQNGTFSGTSSGTNTGDQTITLTGDVTGSGTGSFAATIANDAVTYAKLQNVSATSRILGRKTAAAGDTEECTLSEILDFVGSAAQGDILYRGASTWTRLAAGTNGHYLQTKGSGANPEWAAVSGGSGGTKTYAVFTAEHNQPPATAFATLDTRNSIAVLDFDAATDESAVFVGVIPEGASLGSGLKVFIHWMASTATSGNCRWGVQFEKSGTDLDSDSFDTATEAHSAANGTSGIETVTEITATAIDSLAAGNRFRLKVFRNADDATNDTMTGDAELIAIEVRSAA